MTHANDISSRACPLRRLLLLQAEYRRRRQRVGRRKGCSWLQHSFVVEKCLQEPGGRCLSGKPRRLCSPDASHGVSSCGRRLFPASGRAREEEEWTSLASARIPAARTELLTEDFSDASERLSAPSCFVNLSLLLGPCQSSDVLGKRGANETSFQNNS